MTRTRTGLNAIDLFTAKVETAMERGMKRDAAIRAVVMKHPELHTRYLEEATAQQHAQARPQADPRAGSTSYRRGTDDPIAAFNSEVAKRMDRGATRSSAVSAVARANSQLHADFLIATNKGRPAAQRRIKRRMGT